MSTAEYVDVEEGQVQPQSEQVVSSTQGAPIATAASVTTLGSAIDYGSTTNAPKNYKNFLKTDGLHISRFARPILKSGKSIGSPACSTALFSAVIASCFVVPTTMIIMGACFVSECPGKKMLPVNLILGGALCLLSSVANVWMRRGRFKPDLDAELGFRFQVLKLVTAICNICILISFIAGCVLAYGPAPSSKNPNSNEYCSAIIIEFAFWLYTSAFMFTGLLFCLGFAGLLWNMFC